MTSMQGEGRPERRLRVLLATDTYSPDVNGASYFTKRLAVGLAQRGHAITVVCPAHPRHREEQSVANLTVVRTPSFRTGLHPTFRVAFPLAARRSIALAAKQSRPQVIHLQSHFAVGRAAARLARDDHIPVVATNHFMPENLIHYVHLPPRGAHWLTRVAWSDCNRQLRRVDALTAPTQTAVSIMARNGAQGSITAISCGVDIERFGPLGKPWDMVRKRPGLSRGRTVLYVGRLDPEKHVNELIDAIAEVRQQVVDAQLVIVGVGIERARLEQRAESRGVRDAVTFMGVVSDNDLPFVYRACDVFCMPSPAELQSIACLEALATGMPLVVADAGALPELVRPNVNGYLYSPGNVKALAQSLTWVLASPATRLAMGAASRGLAEEHEESRTLTAFERLYAGVTGQDVSCERV